VRLGVYIYQATLSASLETAQSSRRENKSCCVCGRKSRNTLHVSKRIFADAATGMQTMNGTRSSMVL
jgi:hypothetical protein